MKTNMIKVAFVAAITMVCGANFLSSEKCETLSDVALANVEALADKTPENNLGCFWDSKDYITCSNEGIWLACPCEE